MTTWKPGDVAIVTAPFLSPVRAIFLSGRWVHEFGSTGVDVATSTRPLVVIDPGVPDDVKRLGDILDDLAVPFDEDPAVGLGLWVQAALREFANPTPPKPAEPTGFGAVVEDADGTLWTRFTREYDYDAVWSHETSHAGNRAYSTIAAVRVLSEGVAP